MSRLFQIRPTHIRPVHILIVAILTIAVFLGWWNRAELPLIGGYFSSQTKAETRRGGRATPVDVALIAAQTLADRLQVLGATGARQSVTITSEITARIAEQRIRDGGQVQKGDMLVRFDSAEIEAELTQARAVLKLANQDMARGAATLKKGLIAEARGDQLAQAVANATAEARRLEARLQKYTLRAPFDGRLGLKQVSVGALVRPGDPIVTLDNIAVMNLDFDVPEAALRSLRPGQTLEARASAWPERVIRGVVSTIDTRVDPATRAVTVRAEIDNADGALRPGMFLNVQLTLGRRENVILAPEEAILKANDGDFVFTVRDGKAVRQAVSLGPRHKGKIEINAGLATGDVVITGGLQKVRPGAPVTMRNNPGADS